MKKTCPVIMVRMLLVCAVKNRERCMFLLMWGIAVEEQVREQVVF